MRACEQHEERGAEREPGDQAGRQAGKQRSPQVAGARRAVLGDFTGGAGTALAPSLAPPSFAASGAGAATAGVGVAGSGCPELAPSSHCSRESMTGAGTVQRGCPVLRQTSRQMSAIGRLRLCASSRMFVHFASAISNSSVASSSVRFVRGRSSNWIIVATLNVRPSSASARVPPRSEHVMRDWTCRLRLTPKAGATARAVGLSHSAIDPSPARLSAC